MHEAAQHTAAVDEVGALQVVQAALRSLLRVRDEHEAVALLVDTVRGLGGEAVSAREVDEDILPVDLTFGLSQPLLAAAPPHSVARLHLERYLPQLIEDFRVAVQGLRNAGQLSADATTDPLTGLVNRRGFGQVLARLRPGDSVAALDLDHFKRVNDTHGHAAGDQLLRAFAAHLRDGVRQREHCARYGGEEFVVVFLGTPVQGAVAALERLRSSWQAARSLPVTFSAGVAEVAEDEAGRLALPRADAALYQAKAQGRDRIVVADDSTEHPSAGEETMPGERA